MPYLKKGHPLISICLTPSLPNFLSDKAVGTTLLTPPSLKAFLHLFEHLLVKSCKTEKNFKLAERYKTVQFWGKPETLFPKTRSSFRRLGIPEL